MIRPGGRASGRWAARLSALDRRWLYLGVLVVTVAGTLWPPALVPRPSPSTRRAWSLAQALRPGDGVFIWIEYGLGSSEELDPMLLAVLQHLMERGARIVLAARAPEAALIAEEVALRAAADRPAYRDGYGRTWVNLGYRPAPDVALRASTAGIAAAFNGVDWQGRALAGMPIMAALTALDARHFALTYTFDSADGFAAMIYYVGTPTGLPVVVGAISMEVPVLQPYLAAHQLAAVIGGARGAAEYEELMGTRGPARPLVGASALAAGYVLAVIALGNLVSRLGRRRAP